MRFFSWKSFKYRLLALPRHNAFFFPAPRQSKAPVANVGHRSTIALARARRQECGVERDRSTACCPARSGDGPTPSVPRVPGYQVGYTREAKQHVGITTMAGAMISEPRHAEATCKAMPTSPPSPGNSWITRTGRSTPAGFRDIRDPLHRVDARESAAPALDQQHRREFRPRTHIKSSVRTGVAGALLMEAAVPQCGEAWLNHVSQTSPFAQE